MGFGVWGLGSGVWGLGFGVWGLGFGVWGLGFGVWVLGIGFGFGVWGLGIYSLGFQVWDVDFNLHRNHALSTRIRDKTSSLIAYQRKNTHSTAQHFEVFRTGNSRLNISPKKSKVEDTWRSS